jgi:MFS family permease
LTADPRARLTGTVFVAVTLGSTSLFAAYTVAPLVTKDLSGNASLAGVPGACTVLGTAIGSAVLSSVMARRGRRRGLTLGWAIGCAGAVLAAYAAKGSSLPWMFAGLVLIGIGHSSNQLARFAATDVYEPAKRAYVLGWIVWSITIGSAAGPLLLHRIEGLTQRLGFPLDTSGYLVAIAFYGGALLIGQALRPDPSTFAKAEEATPDVVLREYFQRPTVRLAIGALLSAQAAMNLVMSMTPLHLKEHGHDLGSVGLVMSAHVIGMFAFSPLVGRYTQRVGHARAMLTGIVVLLVATLGAAAMRGTGLGLIGPLFLLGIGWSFSFVSGSALLTQGLSYAQRARVQGRVDAVVWSAAVVATLLAGVAVDIAGYAWLCVGATIVALIPTRAALRTRVTPA